MKTSNYFKCGLLLVGLSFTIFSGCKTTGSSASGSTTAAATMGNASSGMLVINRSANMGTGLFLNVSVDGKKVGSVSAGQSYKGSLSPGTHVVTVLLQPNDMNLSPTKKTITVNKGQAYTFTASWNGNTLALE